MPEARHRAGMSLALKLQSSGDSKDTTGASLRPTRPPQPSPDSGSGGPTWRCWGETPAPRQPEPAKPARPTLSQGFGNPGSACPRAAPRNRLGLGLGGKLAAPGRLLSPCSQGELKASWISGKLAALCAPPLSQMRQA